MDAVNSSGADGGDPEGGAALEASGRAGRLAVLLHLGEDGKGVWPVFLVSFLLGALYGAFVTPLWNEMVECGQLLAGQVEFGSLNSLAYLHAHEVSTQTIAPAILLKLGMGTWLLSLLTSAVVCGLSFGAWALCALALSECPLFAVAVPLVFLGYPYGAAHFYPVVYPIDFFIFGQVGLYCALLTLGFHALGKVRATFLMLGLLPGIHAPWALGVWLGVAGHCLVCRRRPPARQAGPWFVGGFLLSVGLVVYGKLALKPLIVPVPQTAPAWAAPRSPPAAPSGDASEAAAGPTRKGASRGVFQGHNVVIHQQEHPWRVALAFLAATLKLVGGVVTVWIVDRRMLGGRAWDLLLMLGVILAIALVYKLLEELDPAFGWLGMLDPRLPKLLVRAIVNRWLNLATVVAPTLALAMLARLSLARGHREWMLPVLAAFVLKKGFFWILALALVGVAVVPRGGRGKDPGGRPERSAVGSKVFAALLMAFLVLKAARFGRQALREARYRGIDRYEPIARHLRKGHGAILLAPGVQAYDGFNVQVRSGRSIFLPGAYPLFAGEQSGGAPNPYPNVYCFDPAMESFAAFYAQVQECFEAHGAEDWRVIGYGMGVTNVLVPASYRLALPEEERTAEFVVYGVGG